MANGIGSHNPIRYRGYYYDIESGFYYLKSRFYDPNTGKFLNADSVSMLITGEKAYTYCENNPVNFNDSTGTSVGYVDKKLYLIFDVNAWSDTMLLAGLSLDQTTFSQLAYLCYMHKQSNLGKIYWKFYDMIINDILYIESNGYEYIDKTNIVKVYPAPKTYYSCALGCYFYNIIEEYENPIVSYVYGQNSLSNWRYGMRTANENACGIVAIYNALTLIGKKVHIADLIFISQVKGFQNHANTGGTNTGKMIEYLAPKYNFIFMKTDDAETFYEWSTIKSSVLIASHWNDAGKKEKSHATSAYVDYEGVINIYNFVNSSVDATRVNKWTDEIEQERYNYGYRIINGFFD